MGPIISFVWQGSSEPHIFNHWNDGLREAMRILEKKYTIRYREPWDTLDDVVLYWEAPCTAKGHNAEHYNRIRNSNKPKALLFAGGPIEYDTTPGFDMYFVESGINEGEMDALGLPWKRAFGVNDRILKPKKVEKVHEAFFQATFADWKRHQLFAEAMGNKGVLAGRVQEGDRNGYNRAVELGLTILPELSMEEIRDELNKSWCVVNTSSYWGGGQRTTLEALACNCPVIVMDDSPKNVEYIDESGCGKVVPPNAEAIREAVKEVKTWTDEQRAKGREYINKKWTAQHYADSIDSWLQSL
jgi:glycosyltransferase involved in cell wall biosynthesis